MSCSSSSSSPSFASVPRENGLVWMQVYKQHSTDGFCLAYFVCNYPTVYPTCPMGWPSAYLRKLLLIPTFQEITSLVACFELGRTLRTALPLYTFFSSTDPKT